MISVGMLFLIIFIIILISKGICYLIELKTNVDATAIFLQFVLYILLALYIICIALFLTCLAIYATKLITQL